MTTPIAVTPETLTFDHIRVWDAAEMKRQMAHPEMREAITNVIKSKSLEEVLAVQEEQARLAAQEVPEKTPEEIAADEALRSETERAIAEKTAAEEEQRRKAAEPKKFVIDYQVKDEDGNPIGRPTHLEATSEEELRGKIIEAHVQATRAFHRLKKQKISFKEQPVQPVAGSDVELLEAMKDLKSDDPRKQLEALKKVQKTESDKIRAEEAENKRQSDVSLRFLARHKNDFNNCKANIELVKEYFVENPELSWTDDNLEICLHAIEHKLAPVEPVAPEVPANPAPTVTPVTQQVAPVVVQPQATAPVPTAVPANPAPTVHRPGVNGSIVPGQASATRPVTNAPKTLTAEEIRSWDGPTMRAKLRNPVIKAQFDAFVAARNQGKK